MGGTVAPEARVLQPDEQQSYKTAKTQQTDRKQTMPTQAATKVGSIETKSLEIKACFNSYRYTIPDFQREYSWIEDNLQAFWNDITKRIGKENAASHFLGATVIYYAEKGDNHPDLYGIIDGQQRLTTAQILLAALRDKLDQYRQQVDPLKNADLWGQLNTQYSNTHSYLVKSHEDRPSVQYPTLTTDDEFFRRVISQTQTIKQHTQSNPKIKDAYRYFMEQLDERLTEFSTDEALEEIIHLRKALLTSNIVQIETPNLVSASVIFETLNDRGMQLSTENLIKNLLIREGAIKEADTSAISEAWKTICKQAEALEHDNKANEAEKQPGKFIRHSWFSRRPYTTQRKFYNTVADAFDEGEIDTQSYLNELHEDYRFYKLFNDESISVIKSTNPPPAQAIREVVDSLRALTILNVNTHYPLLLAAMRKYEKKELPYANLVALCNALEVFFFYSLNDKRNGRIAELFSRNAYDIHRATDKAETVQAVNKVIKYLQSKIPSDLQKRMQVFNGLIFTNKDSRPRSKRATKSASIVRYVLIKLCQHNNKIARGIVQDGKNYSIEHIIGDEKVDSHNLPSAVHHLGNLVVLDALVNSSLPSKFQDKKDILIANTPYVDEILKTWSETPNFEPSAADLQRRLEHLSHIAATEVWIIPDPR